MTETTGRQDPETIRADIDRTREELGDTVEELAARVDVKTRAKEKAAEVRSRALAGAGHFAATAKDTAQAAAARGRNATRQTTVNVRQRPTPYAAIAATVVAGTAIFVWMRRRRAARARRWWSR